MGWGVTALVALGEVERAREWAARAMLLDPNNANLRYNLACNMVTLGDFDAAIELLTSVISGMDTARLIWWRSDNSLDPIREDPRFKALIASVSALVDTAKAP